MKKLYIQIEEFQREELEDIMSLVVDLNNEESYLKWMDFKLTIMEMEYE